MMSVKVSIIKQWQTCLLQKYSYEKATFQHTNLTNCSKSIEVTVASVFANTYDTFCQGVYRTTVNP